MIASLAGGLLRILLKVLATSLAATRHFIKENAFCCFRQQWNLNVGGTPTAVELALQQKAYDRQDHVLVLHSKLQVSDDKEVKLIA